MEAEPQEEAGWGEAELNQNGRPKQKVLFY